MLKQEKRDRNVKKLLIALLASATFSTAACAETQPANTAAPAANAAAGNATAQAPLPDADPAMWVVRDADTTIYLFGTFHLLDGKSDWFNDEVRQAFDQSQELVFEVDMPSDQAALAQQMQPLIMRYAIDPQQRSIAAELTPEQNRVLNDTMMALGAPAAAFDKFEPWFVSLTLSGAAAQKIGMSGDQGAEAVIRRASEGRQMTRGGVETLEQQIRIFDEMPRAAQIAQLKDSLDNMDQMRTVFAEMLRVWNAGDAEGLERVMNEGMRETPALRAALLENRNRAWAEWIDQRMDRPGTVFMAVGAGHLVGPDSVQTFLRQRGISSERVAQLTPER